MVKKTRLTYLLKTIRKNGVSFFDVALIAATSIAIFLGIQSGAVTILNHTDAYFRENRLASVEITCANGITAEDIQALNDLEQVDTAEGGYQTTAMMEGTEEVFQVHLRSLLEELNQPVIVEGVLPQTGEQVAVEEKFAREQGISLGDWVNIDHDGQLNFDVFQVTAIINDPCYTCVDIVDARGRAMAGFGSVDYYLEFVPDAFNTGYFGNCYTTAYAQNQALSIVDFYSDDYAVREAQLLETLEVFAGERAQQRCESLTDLVTQMGGDASQISREDWVLLGRNSMGDVSGVKTVVQGLFTLSYSFSLIFLLVAVIVCYAAVVKLIDGQRNLIGAQKALGFRGGEILCHFLGYNLLCALLGIAIGYAGAVIIVENLVLYIFGSEFAYPSIPLGFAWKEAVAVAVLCLAIFVAATFAGCLQAVRKSAISLLRGEIPGQKKAYFFESWPLYRKMSLYNRTMIRNVLLDKGRILITIMGVIGCMSLLMITYTLKTSISNATDVQFENYFLYENRLEINSQTGDVQQFESVLDESGIAYLRIQDKLHSYRALDQNWGAVRVIALSGEEKLDGFLHFEDIETGQSAQIPTDGVLISRKCAENNDLSVGDMIELMDASGNPKQCRVAGVIEHYLPYHLLVTSQQYYQQLLGQPSDASIFLLKGDISGLYEKVRGLDGFLSLKDNSEYKNSFSSFNLVIGVCVVFSAILAVLVLLNQMTMYISRKATELTVMRINGYTIRETEAFISQDNLFLIGIGMILGSIVGTPLAQLEVIIVESGPSRYIRTANPMACVFGAGLCGLFAILVNKIALRKIRKLRLTNVNGN